MNSICIICDEKITASKIAECPYCNFITCRTCVRKYVVNETEPKCMNCKKVWTRAHQNTVLKPSFVNKELREHLERVYYEREMALFPATIEVIEDRRLVKKLEMDARIQHEHVGLISANIRYLDTIIREKNRIIAVSKTAPIMYSDYNLEELTVELEEMSEQRKNTIAERTSVINQVHAIDALLSMTPEERKVVIANNIDGAKPREILETLRRTGRLGEAVRKARTQFVRACPIETCRGFLSKQWKCGICGIFTCSKCNVPKCNVSKSTTETDTTNNQGEGEGEGEGDTNNEHVCNPDDVATAELLASDTKPCPKCGTGIYKIDGCDQMWCTECRTAFNWVTGSLETGHVHNPHYFEYQRRIGANVRNIMDIPCGGLAPDEFHGIIHHLMMNVISFGSKDPVEREKRGLAPFPKDLPRQLIREADNYTISIHQFATTLLPRYRPDAIQNNLELRVSYLTKEITEDEFKSALSREAKQHYKRIEIGQVIQTVVYGMSDILTRLVEFLRRDNNEEQGTNYCNPDEISKLFREIDALIEYANECLEFICKQYKLTRVAIFARNNTYGYQPGLYTAREAEEKSQTGEIRQVLQPVRIMY